MRIFNSLEKECRKADISKMLKECKMWAEVIPAEISKADTELGRYFSGAGNFEII